MSEKPNDAGNPQSVETVVHELRGPLTVIRGYLEVLSRPMAEDQRTHAIGAALRAVDRMQLMLSEMTGSGFDLTVVRRDRIVSVDPVALAKDVCEEFAPLFDCRLVAEPMPPGLRADGARVRQALANLVANAGEHGGGEVVIAVTEDAGEIVWAVEDDGPGIASKDRESILAPGVRIGEPQRGRGLGLAISSAIAHAHGGAIVICEPEILTGARVELRLPINA